MTNRLETGHAKNVANFSTLISIVKGFNATYNPSKPSIALTALTTLKTKADATMTNVNALQGTYSTAIANREKTFDPLSKLTTRVVNALRSTDAPKPAIRSAESIMRKIQGRRATPKKSTEEIAASETESPAAKQISSSQMGFDNRIANFDRLIQLLTTVSLYAPNEADLKIASLTTLFQSLQSVNALAVNAETNLDKARIARNEVLYQESTGMVDTATAVKFYVKSVFGATSPQYKQVAALTFKSLL